MSKSNEAQTAQVSGGAKATAESYDIIKSGNLSTPITREEYTTISRLFERNDISHLVGCGYLFGKINYEFSSYFESLPQAVMVLTQHAEDNEVLKVFINSLTAVNGALAAITEHRTQLTDLEMLFDDLEKADIIYTVKH